MSAMEFRESNMVNWFGVRPAHNGTQIGGYDSAENTTVDLYVNSSGKTSFIHTLIICVSPGAAGTVRVYVADSSDVLDFYIYRRTVTANNYPGDIVVNYVYPLEIPNGYKIRINTNAAGLIIQVSYLGWEE